jgi:hypothetical protein
MMTSLRTLRRKSSIPTPSSSSSTNRIRTRPHEPPEFAVDVADADADADADAALLRPIAEDGSPAGTAAGIDVFAKGRESLMMKSGRSPSLASLATCTTESSSSMHSAIEDMAAMMMPMGADDDDGEDAGGYGALHPENQRQPPTSASAASRRRTIIRNRGRHQGQGGCLRIKTQQASLQQKYHTSKHGTKSSSASSSFSFSSRAAGKNRTEHFDAESELEWKTLVGFSHITVHSHQLILGDNPSPAAGPPVSIAWTAFDTVTVPVDDYEKSRAGPPRHHSELQAPGALRTAWLLRAGYSLEEIATAEKQIRVIQRRRMASLPSHSSLPVHSPYNPRGNSNLQVRKGVAKLWPRTWARRLQSHHDDGDSDETGAVIFVDEA